MSPTPTDVGYRAAHAVEHGSHDISPCGPVKGICEAQGASSASSESNLSSRSETSGNTLPSAQVRPSTNSTAASSGSANGSGAGVSGGGESENGNGAGGGPNMSSGISVQELKHMTAVRMAHTQGHLRVVSPFSYGSTSQTDTQEAVSASTSEQASSEHNDVRSDRPGVSRSASSRSMSGNGNDAPRAEHQRERRHSAESLVEAANGMNGCKSDTNSSGSSTGSRSGGRRRSPSPLFSGRASPPAPPPHQPVLCSSSSSTRASPATSSMPHGLTVQELKELTKMRLAREAFNLPVYALVPSSNGSQSRGPSPAPPGAKGNNRSRVASPSVGPRRPPGSRASSPGGVARSVPSSPDHDRAGSDRPHRRTRRGGRRGRNRSPRPDDCSPRLAHMGSGSTLGSMGVGSRDGYSSASPSPRGRRGTNRGWNDLEDRTRSSSQPRTSSRGGSGDPHNATSNHHGASASGACFQPGRRNGDRHHGGGPSAPHYLDMYHSGPSAVTGVNGSHAGGIYGEEFGAHGPSGRRGTGSGTSSMSGRDYPGRDGRGPPSLTSMRGRQSPSVEGAWIQQDADRRFRDGGRGGAIRDKDRTIAYERDRIMIDRPRGGPSNERGHHGGYDGHVVHRRGKEEWRETAPNGGDRQMHRRHDARDEHSHRPAEYAQLYRAHSDGISSVRNGRAGGNPRYGQHRGAEISECHAPYRNGMSRGLVGTGNGDLKDIYEQDYYEYVRRHAHHQTQRASENHGTTRFDEINSDIGRYDALGSNGGSNGSWKGGLPSHAPHMSRRGASDGGTPMNGDSFANGVGGKTYVPVKMGANGGDRHGSILSASDSLRQDISHTVAESVLTPKNSGASVQWRNRNQTQKQNSTSWLQGRDPTGYSHCGQGGQPQDQQHLDGVFGLQGHDQCSGISVSYDAHTTMRSDHVTSGNIGGWNNGRTRDRRIHRESTLRENTMSADSGYAMSTSVPNGMLGKARGGGFLSGTASPMLSQSPSLSGTHCPGSAPSVFQEEFLALAGDGGGKGSFLSSSYTGDSGMRGNASPLLSNSSPLTGALTTASEGHQSAVGSPVMSGLPFALDLAGCGGSSSTSPDHKVSFGTMSEDAGSVRDNNSDFFGGLEGMEGLSLSSAREHSSQQQHPDIGSAFSSGLAGSGAPSLDSSFFSFNNARHKDTQAGIDEIAGRLRNQLSGMPSGFGSKSSAHGPGTIGTRSNSSHTSVNNSPDAAATATPTGFVSPLKSAQRDDPSRPESTSSTSPSSANKGVTDEGGLLK